MKTNSFAQQTGVTAEKPFTTYNSSKARNQRPGVVKLLPAPAPPDEALIGKLNEMAANFPFCRHHKAKTHDTL